MPLEFESDFKNRLMQQTLPNVTTLECSPEELKNWKQAWQTELAKWHSPYKALVDLQAAAALTPQASKEIIKLFDFFLGFHIQKLAVVVKSDAQALFTSELLPPKKYQVFSDMTQARQFLGLKDQPLLQNNKKTNFRDQIQIQNFFQQRTMEVGFASPVVLASSDDIGALKSKITNNLMQWHSQWNLLLDFSNVEQIQPEASAALESALEHFKRLYLGDVAGYRPRTWEHETLPFKLYRSRHRATAALTTMTERSSDQAHCRKP